MSDFWIKVAVRLFALGAGLTVLVATGKEDDPLYIAVAVLLLIAGWILAKLFTTRDPADRVPAMASGQEHSAEKQDSPIQVYLPDWEGQIERDFYQDGITQWKGFKQAEKESVRIHNRLRVNFNKMYEGMKGEEILGSMKRQYEESHSRFFIITMSGKTDTIRDGFIAWHLKCVATSGSGPILVVTVASAPNVAQVKGGIFRWYIRSKEESKILANQLDRKGFSKAAAFCITQTPGSSDDRYGVEGLNIFKEWFDGVIPEELVSFVTAQTSPDAVKKFLVRVASSGDKVGVFIIGYGNMVKNTLAELISGGYTGCIVCTSTVTDPQWRPSPSSFSKAKCEVFTATPVLAGSKGYLVGDNKNVVFFFARKTLLRVIYLSANGATPREFVKQWMNGVDYDQHELNHEPTSLGDINVSLHIENVGVM